MDGFDRLVLGALGGGLVVHGLMRIGATKPSHPFSDNIIERMIEVPDDAKRAEAKFALFVGIAFLLAVVFR